MVRILLDIIHMRIPSCVRPLLKRIYFHLKFKEKAILQVQTEATAKKTIFAGLS